MQRICILVLSFALPCPALLAQSATPAFAPVTTASGEVTTGDDQLQPIPATGSGDVQLAAVEQASMTAPVVTDTAVDEEIGALQSVLESATDLAAEQKQEFATRLDKAKKWVKEKRSWIAERESAEQEIATASERTAEIRERLAAAIELPTPQLPADATVALLDSKLDEIRQHAEAAEAKAAEAQATADNRAARLAQLSKEIQEVESRLNDASKAIASTPSDDLAARIARVEQQARLLFLQAKLPALKAQRSLVEATGELTPLQRDLSVRTAMAAKKQWKQWEELVSRWRKRESQRQAAQARRIVQQAHPALRSIAEKNAEIAELRVATASGIERVAKALSRIDKSSKLLGEQYEELQGKVEHAGATSSTGILLRQFRSELPGAEEFEQRAALVAAESPAAHLQLMELKQLRRERVDDDEAVVARILASLDQSLAKYDGNQVAEIVRSLIVDRRNLLEKANPDQDAYLRDLNELELANERFAKEVDEMRAFLDQHVLWMRSNEALGLADLQQAASELGTLLAPPRWLEVVRVCVGDLVRRPAFGFSAITLLVMLIVFRARLLAKQQQLSKLPRRRLPIRFGRLFAAFALTFVVSVRWPLLLAAIGYRAQVGAGATPWTIAVGEALMTTILFVWGFEVIRELSNRNGIGERLFRWSPEVTASIRNTADTTLWVGAALFAILQLTSVNGSPAMESLQRVMFITVLLLVGFQISWLVRPQGRLMISLRTHSPEAPVYRLRYPIWILATAVPLVFASMSAIGYHFSAYQLSGRLAESGAAIVAMIVAYSLALCWLRVNAHNVELQRQAAERAAAQSSDDTTATSDDVVEAAEQQEIHAAASKETQDLLRHAAVIALLCGGWFVWSDVTPALRVLDEVEVWHVVETISEKVTDAAGNESIEDFERYVPTTLTDVLVAIAICIATLIVGRRLPGLLELVLLDRLPLDRGGRQAIAILVRYAATLAGILVACQTIHLSWSRVQWLAAAMTVGLGFGLQEIFANLVSGLIILFERPIRAGDLVTVDNITGNVTRMQMRATTITDFDHREFIVPNKRFITDNVINWTLSDPVSRVVLPVGVAYGTDVDQVHEMLMRIARREPLVINEPAPTTIFRGFGNSTLDFELRVFIAKRDWYIDVVNRINGAIAREFARANVEIAFPQLDLHVKPGTDVMKLVDASDRTQEIRMDAKHDSAPASPAHIGNSERPWRRRPERAKGA